MVAVVAIGIGLSSGGSDAPSTGSVAPFYIEAVVTQYVEPDDSAVGTVEGAGTGRSIRSRDVVRWWHQDRDHARFEFERTDPPLSASSFTMIFDGARLVGYSSTDNSYEIQQPPPASSTAGGFFWPGKTILFGPSIEPSIPTLLIRLSHWNEGPVDTGPASAFNSTPLPVPTPTPPGLYGPAVKVGETGLLGRRAVVLERSPAPYEQTVKMWVDPESMMVLRHESNIGRWVAEITVMDAKPRFDGSLFVFNPPPGAVDKNVITPAAGPGRPPSLGRDAPSGFYEPRGVPLGLQLGGVRSEANPDGVVFYRAEFHREADPATILLTFEQRRSVAPLPATLAAGERLTVGGYDAYLSQAGTELRLAWSDGHLWLLVTTALLSREEMLAFAASLQRVP